LLEENIPDDKKHYNKRKVMLYKLCIVLEKTVKNVLNSDFYNKLSFVCYKLLIISLFLFSYFILRYNSLLLMGPGWEIPVDLVKPMELNESCVQLSSWLCILFFIIGYRRFNKQRLLIKSISILWFIANITLSIYFTNALPKDYSILVINYWWVGLILPGILIPILIYTDLKLNKESYEEYTSKIHVLKKNKLFDHIQSIQMETRTKYILDYFKKNYKKTLHYLLILIIIIAYHPKSSDVFWKYLLGIEKSELIFTIDIFINFAVLISVLYFESRFKLKYRFERITRNIPEHRMGTVSFVLVLTSLTFLFLTIYFVGYLTNEIVIDYLLAYVGYTIPFYTLYIVGG
jgi:hypothetical protein